MNIFKMFKEWFIFFKYKNTIDKLSKESKNWKNYNFEKGWLRQFGTIIKLRREDLQDRFGNINDDDIFVKTSVIRHLEPFKEELDALGLSSVIKPVIKRYYQPDKVDVFYKVTFWFIFEHTKFKNIFLLILYIFLGYYFLIHFNDIKIFLFKIMESIW